jgi:subfamily B ATP-binding cassette protein MsbA
MNAVEAERFRKENYRFKRAYFRSTLASAFSSPLIETLGAFVAVFLLWYGGSQVLAGTSLRSEDFLRFLLFLFAAYRPLKSLSSAHNSLQTGAAAADRVFTLMDKPTEPILTFSEQRVPRFEKEVRFENVSFTYPECPQEVLHGISFTLRKGSITALVGPSGSGKSTILDLAPRFYEVRTGTITIDTVPIGTMDLAGLRHLFGIVAQETVLFNETVYNNIAYSVYHAAEDKVIEAARAANAWEFIETLPKGLQTEIGENGVMLSGGQRQRLSIARALLKNPPILILDEATSSLDTESERLVQAAINNLMVNRTVLVVAHRLSTIQHADQILVLEKGAIIERGTHSDLLERSGRYKQLHDLQFTS